MEHLADLKRRWAERESQHQRESTRISTILHLNDTLPPMPGKPHNKRPSGAPAARD